MAAYDDLAARVHADRVCDLLLAAETQSSYRDGGSVRLFGLVEHVEKKTTKNGGTMAFVRLEDRTGSIECLVFSRLFQEKQLLLREGEIVYGEGRLSLREEKEPTVDQEGALRYTCARCGRTRTEALPFRFADVKPGAYYETPVYWALRHEPRITSGTDATHFSPKKTCTREQVVSFLWAAMGKPEPETPADAAHIPFVDVKPTAYSCKAVLWAVENGVTTGTDANHFSPKKGCTREQVAAFLWTLAGKPEPMGIESPFADVPAGKYYFKPVLWAVENGVTEGVGGGKFGVGKTCTRGQIVTFLYKAMTNPALEFCQHSYSVESGSPASCTKAATERRTCTR